MITLILVLIYSVSVILFQMSGAKINQRYVMQGATAVLALSLVLQLLVQW